MPKPSHPYPPYPWIRLALVMALPVLLLLAGQSLLR